MRIINAITDKTDWHKKVFDISITEKWRAEIAQSGQDVSTKIMDWIIEELQWKADISKSTGFVQTFDDGVVKSDTAIPPVLQLALRNAVKPLEDVPEDQKDYHPGSDGKVVDLVHPSLFPLILNRPRVVSDGVLGLDNCLDSIGIGEVVGTPREINAASERRFRSRLRPPNLPVLSQKFQ